MPLPGTETSQIPSWGATDLYIFICRLLFGRV
jgi:hypothetical protein